VQAPLLCETDTDRQEVHVCLDDRVFCMEDVERRCEGKDGGRLHLAAGSEAKVSGSYK